MTIFTTPDLPGTKVSIVAEPIVQITPSGADTVAVIQSHDKGPINQATLLSSFADFETVFGSGDTPGRRAALMAFNGGGLPEQGGAGGVLFYRIAGASARKATKQLSNGANPALQLDALTEGVDGNLIGYTVTDDPAASGTNDILRIFYKGVEVERYIYAQANIAQVAADVNARSRYVKATSLVTGTALTFVSSLTLLTLGDDGASYTSANYLAALDAFEYRDFSVLCYDGVDDTIRAALYVYVEKLQNANRPIELVQGGAVGDTVSTALARTAAVPETIKHHVVNVGVGVYHDDLTNQDYSTAALAPRVAGAYVARGKLQSLTFADFAGLHVVSGAPKTDELLVLRDGGVTAFRRVSSPNTELRIAEGVTAFTSKTDPARLYEIFSEPRIVRVLDLLIQDARSWADEEIVGDTTVTQDTRDAVAIHVRGLINELIAQSVVLPIPEPYVRTPVPTDVALRSAIPFEFGMQMARTTKFVIGYGRVK